MTTVVPETVARHGARAPASFAEEILETIQQQHDPEALRDRARNAPRDQFPVDVLDDDEYRVHISWLRIGLLAEMTRVAVEHDLERYYREGDVDE